LIDTARLRAVFIDLMALAPHAPVAEMTMAVRGQTEATMP